VVRRVFLPVQPSDPLKGSNLNPVVSGPSTDAISRFMIYFLPFLFSFDIPSSLSSFLNFLYIQFVTMTCGHAGSVAWALTSTAIPIYLRRLLWNSTFFSYDVVPSSLIESTRTALEVLNIPIIYGVFNWTLRCDYGPEVNIFRKNYRH